MRSVRSCAADFVFPTDTGRIKRTDRRCQDRRRDGAHHYLQAAQPAGLLLSGKFLAAAFRGRLKVRGIAGCQRRPPDGLDSNGIPTRGKRLSHTGSKTVNRPQYKASRLRWSEPHGRPVQNTGSIAMLVCVLCLILTLLCWPLTLLALILWPVMWLLAIPLRLLGVAVGGTFRLLRAFLLLPVRILETGQQI